MLTTVSPIQPKTANGADNAESGYPATHPVNRRRPIRWQLLWPMAFVGFLGSLMATAMIVYWNAIRIRQEQSRSLRRLVETQSEATFPLTQPVLKQMSGLSGAEFVLLSREGRVRESTLPVDGLSTSDLVRVARWQPTGDALEAETLQRNRTYLVDSLPVHDRSQGAGSSTLLILYPKDELAARVAETLTPAMIAGSGAAAFASIIATLLARRIAQPIHRLADQTAIIARGRFSAMPIPERNDELRDLAESINRMSMQLSEYEQQVRRHERLKALGQLGAVMAHHLRNAATGGRMAIELHQRGCPVNECDESLDVALRQLKLMESYLRKFLAIDGPRLAVREPVDLRELVDDVVRLLRPSFAHSGIDVQVNFPNAGVVLRGDPEDLRQLATNLVFNAAEAAVVCGKPPRIRIEVLEQDPGLGSLRVCDNGPGPEPAFSDQLFRSFVTTKPEGVGLGLFVSRQIAERHDGRLSWSRQADETCFAFDFPLLGADG